MVSTRQLIPPEINYYSSSDIELAKKYSPAVTRSLELLKLTHLSPLARLRNENWLRAALSTIHKTCTTKSICEFWTSSADQLIQMAWDVAKLNKFSASCFALGKLGAQELNLSSDVDLVIIASQADQASVLTALRTFRQLLESDSEVGVLLRVDFDLRPGGRFGPIVTTPQQLTDYYWSQGETWERLAWVRSRLVAGDQKLEEQIIEPINSFCFRKYLDFTVLEDLKLLRSRIHLSQTIAEDAVHLKLGVGGIRDLELFVHSLLIIHGGRKSDLRTHSTTQALINLKLANLLPEDDADFLIESYWQLRKLENCVQVIDDQQTHWLKGQDAIEFLPLEEREKGLSQMKRIDEIVSSLLGKVEPFIKFWPESPEAQINWLTQKGIDKEVAEQVWPKLLSAIALSGKTERAEKSRQEFLGRYLEELQAHGRDPNLALQGLLDFVMSSRAKSTLFSLLLREPRLIRDLASIFSTSPYLSQVLSSRPELLDSFLSNRISTDKLDWESFLENLVERRLLTEITVASEFILDRSLTRLGNTLSQCADRITDEVLERLLNEMSTDNLTILPMGKWGGQELGFRSDLDFVVICKESPNETQQRIVRRLVSRMTESHRGGRLYAVDLRLRPSGQSGPLLLNQQSLLDFLKNSADAWQRQSYLRARTSDVEFQMALRKSCVSRGINKTDGDELVNIRQRLRSLHNSKTKQDQIDLKLQEGGLLDIEFAIQIAILKWGVLGPSQSTLGQLSELCQFSSTWALHRESLEKCYVFLRTVEQLHQLTSHQSGSIVRQSSADLIRLARILGHTPEDLFKNLGETMTLSKELLQSLDPLADEI